MDMPKIPDSFKLKSFWERTEGTVGMLGIGIGAVVGIFALYTLLPFLIVLLTNTLTAMLLIGIIGLILSLVFNQRFRTLVSYLFKSGMRAITGLFVEVDPIGILNGYVQELKDSLDNMDNQISKLAGQMKNLDNQIKNNEAEERHAMSMADAARKAKKDDVVTLRAREAGRLNKSNITLKELYRKMELVYRVLVQMRKQSDIMIQDIESEVDVKTRERKAVGAAYNAFRSAYRIIKGDSGAKELYDMAMEHLAQDSALKMGEIENFMRVSGDLLSSLDLEDTVQVEEALKKIDNWKSSESASAILGEDKQKLIKATDDPDNLVDLGPDPVEQTTGGRWNDLFEK